MNIDEIMTLVKAVSDYNLTSFELEEGNVKISLKREKEMPQIVTVGAPAMDAASAAVSAQMMGAAMAAQAAPAAAGAVAEPAADAGISSDKVVTSPLVGTFYNASSPDAEAFVREGDTVKKGQVLGIIEAMKLMNEIESEYDGVVEAVLVKNEEVVEYGQPLFRIR
ncbi:MAG: acetyl-CoA carboxylase biotin carboxyl carrier protein [Enterocloster asparagiformis]|nr:acetyl-CoA carboxylase biotin carboxyl carrier protein [Enterocloster asparagiformis]